MIVSGLMSDGLILVALTFVGFNLVRVDRKLKKEAARAAAREGEQDTSMQGLERARKELLWIVSDAKEETARLQETVRKAEGLYASVTTMRSSLTVESSSVETLMNELKAASAAADRTCTRLSGVMSGAAEAHKKISPPEPAPVFVEPRKALKIDGLDNVVRLPRMVQ